MLEDVKQPKGGEEMQNMIQEDRAHAELASENWGGGAVEQCNQEDCNFTKCWICFLGPSKEKPTMLNTTEKNGACQLYQ